MSIIGWIATTLALALATALAMDALCGGGIVSDVWWVLTGKKRKR